MRKKVLLMFIILVAITGCNLKKSDKTLKLTIEQGSAISLQYDISDSSIISIKEKKELVGACEGVEGCDFHYIYTIKGLKEGQVTLTFNKEYSNKKHSSEQIIYEIKVDKDLNITEEHRSISDFRISISENSSAAQQVEYTISDNTIVSIEETYDDNGCGKSDGCGGYKVYIVKGLKEGRTTLTLTKKNVARNTIIEKVEYEIEVDKNLNITESHQNISSDDLTE